MSLTLAIYPPGTARLVLPSEEHQAGALRRLPAASFDVVVFSLVLSYLPLARQRGAMVAQARRLLPTPDAEAEEEEAEEAGGGGGRRRGLLLVVETLSVDRRASSWAEQSVLQEWVASIEALGFRFLRHEALRRSHALAFVTTAVDGDLETLLADEALPELRMRREVREAGWDGGGGGGRAAEGITGGGQAES